MAHVTIRHMVFVIFTYFIYEDITDKTCYYKTHDVCYWHL